MTWLEKLTSTERETLDYLDGFQAWDNGATSSGIKDDTRREQIKLWLEDTINHDRVVVVLSALIEMRLADGSVEDVVQTLSWLRNELGIDLSEW